MKKTLLFSTILIGLALAGCNKSTRTSTASTDTATVPATTADTTTMRTDAASREVASDVRRGADNAADSMRDASHNTANALSNAGDKLQAKFTEWKLDTQDIQADLAAQRPIVRTKETTAGAPTGSTDDSVIETMVKGKLQADSQTGKAVIEVNASKGEVTLKGSADSASVVGRAIALALDTQGVTKVSSEIKVNAQSNK